MTEVIRVKALNAYYGKKQVLYGLEFSVAKGEIFGLIGPSGCGKTTLVKLFVGLHQNYQGEILVLGQKKINRKLLEEVTFMAQSTALYENLSARDNLRFFGKLYRLKKEDLEKRIEEISKLIELEDRLDDRVSSFSGGMKRRLALAIALLPKPKLIILDEPSVGIDPLLRAKLWRDLRRLANEGITLVITTHIMDEAEHCDRVLIMRDGGQLDVGGPQALIQKANCMRLEEVFIKAVGGELEWID